MISFWHLGLHYVCNVYGMHIHSRVPHKNNTFIVEHGNCGIHAGEISNRTSD